MINERQVKKFCKDYTLIENYEEAVDDHTQTWICHHILGEILTRRQLLDHEFYYDVPPCMLKFVTRSEHNRLHKKGITLSEETRRKLSGANKGKILTEEHRRKLSEARKGKHHSDETRRKISEANNRRILSDETRRKISEAHKGKTLSEETRRKLTESQKRRWAKKRGEV